MTRRTPDVDQEFLAENGPYMVVDYERGTEYDFQAHWDKLVTTLSALGGSVIVRVVEPAEQPPRVGLCRFERA